MSGSGAGPPSELNDYDRIAQLPYNEAELEDLIQTYVRPREDTTARTKARARTRLGPYPLVKKRVDRLLRTGDSWKALTLLRQFRYFEENPPALSGVYPPWDPTGVSDPDVVLLPPVVSSLLSLARPLVKQEPTSAEEEKEKKDVIVLVEREKRKKRATRSARVTRSRAAAVAAAIEVEDTEPEPETGVDTDVLIIPPESVRMDVSRDSDNDNDNDNDEDVVLVRPEPPVPIPLAQRRAEREDQSSIGFSSPLSLSLESLSLSLASGKEEKKEQESSPRSRQLREFEQKESKARAEASVVLERLVLSIRQDASLTPNALWKLAYSTLSQAEPTNVQYAMEELLKTEMYTLTTVRNEKASPRLVDLANVGILLLFRDLFWAGGDTDFETQTVKQSFERITMQQILEALRTISNIPSHASDNDDWMSKRDDESKTKTIWETATTRGPLHYRWAFPPSLIELMFATRKPLFPEEEPPWDRLREGDVVTVPGPPLNQPVQARVISRDDARVYLDSGTRQFSIRLPTTRIYDIDFQHLPWQTLLFLAGKWFQSRTVGYSIVTLVDVMVERWTIEEVVSGLKTILERPRLSVHVKNVISQLLFLVALRPLTNNHLLMTPFVETSSPITCLGKAAMAVLGWDRPNPLLLNDSCLGSSL